MLKVFEFLFCLPFCLYLLVCLSQTFWVASSASKVVLRNKCGYWSAIFTFIEFSVQAVPVMLKNCLHRKLKFTLLLDVYELYTVSEFGKFDELVPFGDIRYSTFCDIIKHLIEKGHPATLRFFEQTKDSSDSQVYSVAFYVDRKCNFLLPVVFSATFISCKLLMSAF